MQVKLQFFSFLQFAIVWASGNLSSVSGAEDKCASSNLYACPSESCNRTIYVKDCLDCDGHLNTDRFNDVCFERKLLNAKDNPSSTYLWRDLAGILVWFLAAGVATACGVGGGGIYVPVGILLLAFAPKPSSGLSQASIFGASLGGLLLNLPALHPFAIKVDKKDGNSMMSVPSSGLKADDDNDSTEYYTRPLIDYDMALFLAPMQLAGAVLGVTIQKIMPNWLYLSLAAIILAFTSYKTYKKYFAAREKEMAERQAAEEAEAQKAAMEHQETRESSDHVDDEENSPARSETEEKTDPDSPEGSEHLEECATAENDATEDRKQTMSGDSIVDTKSRCIELLEEDSCQRPTGKMFALFLLWLGLLVLTFLRGGKGVDSLVGITCASPWNGVMIALQFVWTLAFACIFGYKLVKATEEKKAVAYPFHPQDVLWDYSKTRFYAFFSLIAGVVAGMIGVGGGMVLGPLMLELGVHPRISTATTATMVVLTSSIVAVLFVISGSVPWEYAVTFFSVCFVGALIGKMKIDGYVKRSGRASILIFLLATIIALTTVGCIVIVLQRLAQNDWCFDGFNKFCNLSAEDSDEDICEVDRFLFGVAAVGNPSFSQA